MLDDERWRPRGYLVASRPPEFVAGRFIEGHNERLTFVVPLDDQPIVVEDERRAFAKLEDLAHLAQILFPDEIPVEVIAIQTPGAEIGKDVLAVGDRGVRGKTPVLQVVPLVWGSCDRGLLPQHLARVLVDAEAA